MRIERSQYQQQFRGVVPIKVKVDDTTVTSQVLINKACRKAVKALTTNTKRDSKEYNAMVEYMKKDSDYNPRNILLARRYNPSMTPSYFIRVVNTDARPYFLTGKDADQIRIAGKNIGVVQGMINRMGYKDCLKLHEAKTAYKKAVESVTKRVSSRVTEGFDTATMKKTGSPVEMIINMKSNGKYGQNNFDIEFDSIDFRAVKK